MCAPAAPDPVQTAQAQAGMNIDTAIAQQGVNMIDQHGPTGSQTYGSTGDFFEFTDSQGKQVKIPRYSQTTTFTPEQQSIFDSTQGAKGNLANLAQDQSAFLQDYMAEPFSFDNQDAANWAYDLGSERLDPRFAREEESLRTSLKNSGFAEGSEGWNSEMERLGQSKNDAYNNLMLTGRSQAFDESIAGRNQPINEIIGLMSGSQVQTPQFGATPQAGVGGVDYTGLVGDQYKAEAGAHGAMLGGLFGLASSPFQMFNFGG